MSPQKERLEKIKLDLIEIGTDLIEGRDLTPDVNSIVTNLYHVQKARNRLEWAEIGLKEIGGKIADISEADKDAKARASHAAFLRRQPTNEDEINPLAHEDRSR